MILLVLFLLVFFSVYVGTLQAAFSVLMRLPFRLSVERRNSQEQLRRYLEEPLELFIPARLLQAVTVSLATMLVLLFIEQRTVGVLALIFVGIFIFIVICSHLVPLLIVRQDPERVLTLLLPSFHSITVALYPLTKPLIGLLIRINSDYAGFRKNGNVQEGVSPFNDDAVASSSEFNEHEEEKKLLQSVVEFGDTLVREVMTPRPDIVAVKADASLSELRDVFIEQQYSRIPVYEHSLDNIIGLVLVKDLIKLTNAAYKDRVIKDLMRPVYVVSETKRVATLLKDFQDKHVQSAIVHDEYGGTAGLVTIEDLLEEIVGEIRDEYDVELEPIVDEGNGSFVFVGNVPVDDVSECLGIHIERHRFETIAGYLLARLGRVPKVGEIVDIDEVRVEILDGERRRVRRVRVKRCLAGV